MLLKNAIVILWIIKFQITDRSVIGKLLNISRSVVNTMVSRLLGQNMLREIRVNTCPTPILMLHKGGLGYAQSVLDSAKSTHQAPPLANIKLIHEPSRLNLRLTQHDLLTQHLILSLWRGDHGDYVGHFYREVWSGQELRAGRYALGCSKATGAKASGKIADAILIAKDGVLTAIEVQQTYENQEIVHRKLWQYSEAIRNGEIGRVVFGSSVSGILDAINSVAISGQKSMWMYTEKNWVKIEDLVYAPTDSLLTGMRFQLFDLSSLDTRYYLATGSRTKGPPSIQKIEVYQPKQPGQFRK